MVSPRKLHSMYRITTSQTGHTINKFVLAFPRHLQIKQAFNEPRSQWLLPLEDREFDVGIVASLTPNYPDIVNEHRIMAREMVEYLEQRHQLRVKVYQRMPTTREFYELAQNTKIIISPFALGEAAGKDYESILSGAIKPYSQRLTSSPDIFSGGFSVSCRPDFSDLEHTAVASHVAAWYTGHLRRAQSLVDTAYAKLAKESTDEAM
eukprot:scaffold135473_cov50-Prasinocladus_malaysianus.AAC.2